MSKWILAISLSAVSANSRALWVIDSVPLFLPSCIFLYWDRGNTRRNSLIHSFDKYLLSIYAINIHARHCSSRCGQDNKQDGVVFCIKLFPFHVWFQECGWKIDDSFPFFTGGYKTGGQFGLCCITLLWYSVETFRSRLSSLNAQCHLPLSISNEHKMNGTI